MWIQSLSIWSMKIFSKKHISTCLTVRCAVYPLLSTQERLLRLSNITPQLLLRDNWLKLWLEVRYMAFVLYHLLHLTQPLLHARFVLLLSRLQKPLLLLLIQRIVFFKVGNTCSLLIQIFLKKIAQITHRLSLLSLEAHFALLFVLVDFFKGFSISHQLVDFPLEDFLCLWYCSRIGLLNMLERLFVLFVNFYLCRLHFVD